MLADLLRKLFMKERRAQAIPVKTDRRKMKMKAASQALDESIDRFNRTVRLKSSILASNDPQNIVQFETFKPICTFKGPELAGQVICRHSDYKGSLTACEQQNCPFMGSKRAAA